MKTTDAAETMGRLFSELVEGTGEREAFMLNRGDVGLLQSLDALSAADASRSTNDGATIAAHAQHLRYGLSLMNEWGAHGGNPFANAKWDEAWKVSTVDESAWREIREGLRGETQRWLAVLQSPREVANVEFTGMMSSIAHLAYHLGAIRQIHKSTRGPKEGTFA
jgi:hypothetical protein